MEKRAVLNPTRRTQKAKPRHPMTWKRQVKRLGILLGCAYVLIVLIAAFFGDRLIFPAPKSSYSDLPGLFKISTPDGEAISATYLQQPSAGYTILYSHGNGEDLGTVMTVCELLRQSGFNVLAYDYRGYGTSEGSAGESSACADIRAAYDHLTGPLGVKPERIIVLGRSVGGGPSVDLAAQKPVGALILESAFTSAFRIPLRVRILPWDKFDNLSKLPGVNCPVLVIHGADDWIISSWHGRRLFAVAPEPKRHLWVERAGHNDLVGVAGKRYTAAIRDFANSLAE